jgi:hypothetical protein
MIYSMHSVIMASPVSRLFHLVLPGKVKELKIFGWIHVLDCILNIANMAKSDMTVKIKSCFLGC